MKEKKSSLRFAGRQQAKGGIVSTVIAVVAWLIFAALCVYSFTKAGNAEAVAGMLGILDGILALGGMYFAFRGFQERDVFYLLPALGMVLNGILFVVYFSLYFLGMAVN